jgi:hypothetical protein
MADAPDHPKQVEIKANASGSHAKTAADRFDLSDKNGAARLIWFLESRRGIEEGRLDLLDHGLILRLRSIEHDPDDTTVKLRSKGAPTIPEAWLPSFKVIEGDWAGDQHLISASFTEKVGSDRIEEATRQGGNISRAFSAEQEDYLSHAHQPPIDLDAELQSLGPIQGRKWSSLETDDFPHEIRAERWEIDELQFLEFSIRVDWDEAEEAQRGLHCRLADRGVDLSGLDEPKTTLVLRHLTRIGTRR